ncbi:MAG: DUF2059 domain-containing protein [Candidatus Hydrogenedentes bacterium]|nr:DUF2059 domain-containing protein [Candidatus Hydrogenedentota bacterium]
MNRIRWIALLAFLAPAFAIEDSEEQRIAQANRYIAATPPKELFADLADKMASNLPEESRQAFRDFMTKHFDVESLTNSMRNVMTNHFTADELKALADFYGSPVGKSVMKKFGAYMAEMGPVIESELAKAEALATRDLAQ